MEAASEAISQPANGCAAHPLRQTAQRDLKTCSPFTQFTTYVEEPNIILTVGMPPNGYADTDAIGRVQESRVEGFRQTPIGKCQAWYYPEDTTVVVWECFLVLPQPTEDPNMQKLWQTIEKYFARKFPRADRIVTPFDDPQFQREAYQTFLRFLGYEPVAKAAYGKLL